MAHKTLERNIEKIISAVAWEKVDERKMVEGNLLSDGDENSVTKKKKKNKKKLMKLMNLINMKMMKKTKMNKRNWMK